MAVLSAVPMMSESRSLSSSFRRPWAFVSSLDLRELLQTSSAKSAVLWAGVLRSRPHLVERYDNASFSKLIRGFSAGEPGAYDLDFQPQSFRRQNVDPLEPNTTGAPQFGHSPSFGVELVVNVHSGYLLHP